MKHSILTLILFTVFLNQSYALEKIVYCPHWLSQAQFAGFYVAQELGYYKEAGLEVEIRSKVLNINHSDNLLDSTVDVCTLFLDQAIFFNQKHSLLNLSQYSQHSSLVLVTQEHIQNLGQLNNTKIAIWKDEIGSHLKYLLKNRNIKIKEWVKCKSGLNYLRIKAVSGILTTSYNELYEINHCGLDEDEYNLFWLKDYGYNFPEDGLYCLKKNYKPSYTKFAQATIKGWKFCRKYPQKALRIVYKRMYKDKQIVRRNHQEWMLKYILELQQVNSKDIKSGVPYILHEKQYLELTKFMLKARLIDSIVPYKDFVIQ